MTGPDISDHGAALGPDERIRLLTLARLMRRAYTRRQALPPRWIEEGRRSHWLTGLDLVRYRNTVSGERVIAIKGVEAWDPRDLVAVVIQRRFGYRRSSLRLARKLLATTDSGASIIGHSAGGGLASWLGHELGLPTVTFNSGRTRASLVNDGRRQTNVCIRGDGWGDPWRGFYGMPLPGRYVVLDKLPGSGNRHLMKAIIAALANNA